jgi:hypothetical protein
MTMLYCTVLSTQPALALALAVALALALAFFGSDLI